MDNGVIEMHNTGYDYHGQGTKTIEGINLAISRGEFILITGKSGSGKTTVVKCINGLIPYFHEGILTGDVFVHGHNTKEMELHEIGSYAGSVFQDPRSQFFTTNTTDEVAFGCQNMGLPREEIFERIKNAFSVLGIETLANRDIFKISNGEKQKIAIASCFAMEPDIYIFDEPSANLDVISTLQLARLMIRLKELGKTIIVAEHRLYYLKDLIDRVIFMADGKIVEMWTGKNIDDFYTDDLSDLGLRQLDLTKARYSVPDIITSDKINFTAKGLAFNYPKERRENTGGLLRGIYFTAVSGEVVGITGRNGTGKTTLAKLCCGLLKENTGTIALNNETLSYKKRPGKIYFVMQDSDYQLFSDSVIKELTIGIPNTTKNDRQCEKVLASLGLSQFKDYHPAALSRGQKQRLTIASAVMSSAKVIFFDEPTSGLDGEAMKQVAGIFSTLAQNGCIVFIITHDYEFLLESATRILHLADGTITDDFPLNDKTLGRLRNILFGEKGDFING
jgi:energy-coupling factor transport system ATP-binding protein